MDKPVIVHGSQPAAGDFNAFADYAEFVANEAAGNNFAQDAATTGGLQWGHVGGVVRDSLGAVVPVAAGTVALPASTADIYIVVDETGVVAALTTPPGTTVKTIRQLTTDTATITANTDIRAGFDFTATGSGVTSWNDLTDKPTTVATSGLTDAATTTDVTDEATARSAADTALQGEIDAEETARAAHEAAAAPHSGHLKTDGSTPLTANWDIGGVYLNNLPDPVSAQQPATKAYADAISAGLKPKALVHAATTGNINLSNPGTAIYDNVTLGISQYLLVHKQTTLTENGIYVFNGATSALTRRADFDASSEIPYGAYTFVQAGSTYGGYGLFAIVPSPFTLDTDTIEFSIFTGAQPPQPMEGQNVGTGTGLIHKLVSGLTHYFRSLKAGSNKVSVTTTDDEVEVDVVEANLNLANMGGTTGPTQGGTGLSTYAVGDFLWASATNVLGKLAGNLTSTKKYMTMTSGVPAWSTGPESIATSNTNTAIPGVTGNTKSFYIGTGYSFAVGQHVRAARTSAPTTTYVGGIVTQYASNGYLTFVCDEFAGSGTYNDWTISVNGQPGTPGTLDINGLTEEATIADGDYIPIRDISAGANRKMTRANLLAGYATDADVSAAVAAIVDSSPAALDTLNELAAALGDDENFATTVTNALAGKQPLDDELTALAGLTSAADKVPYFTGLGTAALATLSAFGRSLIEAADAAAVKVLLSLNNVDNTSDSTKNAAVATLTNKRITKRRGSTASSATPTINTDDYDRYDLTALAVDITSMTSNLSGTPAEGDLLWIRFIPTATRAITWGASFEDSTVTLPTSVTTTTDVGLSWNSATSKWRCVAKA